MTEYAYDPSLRPSADVGEYGVTFQAGATELRPYRVQFDAAGVIWAKDLRCRTATSGSAPLTRRSRDRPFARSGHRGAGRARRSLTLRSVERTPVQRWSTVYQIWYHRSRGTEAPKTAGARGPQCGRQGAGPRDCGRGSGQRGATRRRRGGRAGAPASWGNRHSAHDPFAPNRQGADAGNGHGPTIRRPRRRTQARHGRPRPTELTREQ